jgi:hypothetical protein
MHPSPYDRRPDDEPPDRTCEAAREIVDLIDYFKPQLPPGDIYDSIHICAVRVAWLAKQRFGDGWRDRPVLHLYDPDGVPWCLGADAVGADEPIGELCTACVEALELVSTAWERR